MNTYDVAIVGSGIVGLAVAREVLIRQPGAQIVVIDKEASVGAHQTGHNSGVIHSGIYYEPGSLKATLCLDGAARMYEYAEQHAIPHERCGKLIVAADIEELPRLDELERRGLANRVPGLRRIGAEEISEIEPRATGIAALHSPHTGIIDYGRVAQTIADELTASGASLMLNTTVRAISEGVACTLETTVGPVTANKVISCAGLWSDRLAQSSGVELAHRIVPFRGAYLSLAPTDSPVVRGMIYPVPDPSLPFLGVHITRHIDGVVMIGPTAMLVPSRDSYRLRTVRRTDVWDTASWPGTWRLARRYWRTGLDELRIAASRRAHLRAAARYVPGLASAELLRGHHAGVRAQLVDRSGALHDDFVIARRGAVTHVINAPSPAATAAFALAAELVDRATQP